MAESASKDAAPGEPSDDPGRPHGKDELDPELVRLPRGRARIGAVMCASVIALCLIMMVRLRADLAFSRAGDRPTPVDARALAAAAPGAFVELAARPDRVVQLHVFASRATDGHRLMPILGAAGKAWLMIDGDPWDETPGERERYVGRVRRLGDLPFYDDLVAALAALEPVPTAIEPAALESALKAGAGVVTDGANEPVSLGAEVDLAIRETVAGKALVIGAALDSLPDEAAWKNAMARVGLVPAGTAPITGTLESWTFEVDAPAGVDGIAAQLVAARLFAARAEPKVVVHAAKVAQLGGAPEGLVVAGQVVPWASISAVEVITRRPAPSADARVVITGESPGDYWFVVPVYGLLALFAALFSWGLARALRAARTAAA